MPNITVQGYKFEVPEAVIARYEPGYVLQTQGEAHALQQTMLENLRNNFAPRVKKVLDGAESLTPDQTSELQTEFADYAAKYEFGIRQPGQGRKIVDPVEREMFKLAKEDITKAFMAKYNQKPDKETLAEKAEQLIELKSDDYQKRARAIIRQREAVGQETLETLGL